MKTQFNYINENITSLQQYIDKYMGGDYKLAENILKNENLYSLLINGVDEYIKNPDNKNEEINQNNGFMLAKLFNDSGILLMKQPKNYDIVERIILKHFKLIKTSDDSNELLDFIQYANNHKGEENFKKLIKTDKRNNIFNVFKDKKNYSFENLAKYIFNIKDFEKKTNGSESGTSIGNGEMLLQLLFGRPLEKQIKNGDVYIDGLNVEVKCGDYRKNSYASIGSSNIDNQKLSEIFIKNINTSGIVIDENSLPNSILGDRNELQNIRNIVNMVDDNNDIILKSYIQAILQRYNKDDKTIVEEVLKVTPDVFKNLFYKSIDKSNEIKINKLNKILIKHFAGILHIIAYQLQQSFNYLIVFTKNERYLGDYVMIDCSTIEKIFKQCTIENFSFAKPRTKDRANTMQISLKE